MTEAQLQDGVVECARLLGWRVAHFRPARTSRGWRTPVAADGQGFPDLVLVRPPRLIFAELKRKGRRPTEEQQEWLDALGRVGDDLQAFEANPVEALVWTTSDWDSGVIERTLR